MKATSLLGGGVSTAFNCNSKGRGVDGWPKKIQGGEKNVDGPSIRLSACSKGAIHRCFMFDCIDLGWSAFAVFARANRRYTVTKIDRNASDGNLPLSRSLS